MVENKYKSFLIINPFGIGDVLFSTPFIRNIKENFPSAKVFYLCNRRTYPLLKNNPLIEKTFVYERDEVVAVRKRSKILWIKKIFAFISEIKKEKIDIALDLSLNSQFGFFAWSAGIKKRLGLDYKKRGWLLTKKIKIEGFQDRHVADYYLAVLELLNIKPKLYKLEVYPDAKSKFRADKFMAENRISKDELVIGIAPCGGEAFGKDAFVKRWPEEKFSSLIKRLILELKAKIFIFAGPEEKKEVFRIISSVGKLGSCYEFTNCSLEEIIALVDKCSLFIGNDTGPLRFADALDKKVIALFGPVDEKVYGLYPYNGRRHRIIKKDLPCRPCYKKFRLPECPYDRKCLKDISVEEVFNAVRGLLKS